MKCDLPEKHVMQQCFNEIFKRIVFMMENVFLRIQRTCFKLLVYI